MGRLSKVFTTLGIKAEKIEESKTTDVIAELIKTDWSKDNDSQMKAVQLLKGIALSDEPEANAFMKKIDAFTSNMKVDEAQGGKLTLVISDETKELIDKDKKKELKPILDKMVKHIKADVTTIRI